MTAVPNTGDRRYIYQVAFDRAEGKWRGECAEFQGLQTEPCDTPQAAVDQIIALVNDWFRRLVGSGQPTPEGLRQREYSGNPGFRTSPEHHAALVEEARLNNLSLNAYLQLKLTPQPWGTMQLDSHASH